MEITLDLGKSAAELANRQFQRGSGHPEWSELRARLFAARETFSILNQEFGAEAGRNRGSFDPAAALCMATYGNASHAVNPNASANRKPDTGNDGSVADVTRTGDRG